MSAITQAIINQKDKATILPQPKINVPALKRAHLRCIINDTRNLQNTKIPAFIEASQSLEILDGLEIKYINTIAEELQKYAPDMLYSTHPASHGTTELMLKQG